tara:strand:+ start:257 stop:505 length:249 start_codon:yes stop_codon:yes gene_type:complete
VNPKANNTQVTFRHPENQGRTTANVNLALNAKNTTKIITAIEQLNDLMTQKNLSLKKSCLAKNGTKRTRTADPLHALYGEKP